MDNDVPYPPLTAAHPASSGDVGRKRSLPGARRSLARFGAQLGLFTLLFVLGGLGCTAWFLGARLNEQEQHTRSAQLESDSFRRKLKSAQATVAELRAEHHRRSVELTKNKERVRDLSAQLAATDGRLEQYEQERSDVSERLTEFRAVTRKFRSMIDSGHLDVSFRHGRMIVELPAQVLFPSGSADLTADGTLALTEVALVLSGVRDRRFVVAGHTDNVPVKRGEFNNNWELSMARALNVTQALISAGVRPEQLMAAGRAEYEPVASNRTRRGRQKNRRIEIVLEPNLMPLGNLEP